MAKFTMMARHLIVFALLLIGIGIQSAAWVRHPSYASTHEMRCNWLDAAFWRSDDVNKLVQECLSDAHNLDLTDNDGNSFLHYIVSRTRPDARVIEQAIQVFNINSANHRRNTALHLAVLHHKRPKLIELLIAHGADPELANLEGNTPLHLAVIKGSTRHLRSLLRNGASPNAQNNEVQTPLHISVRNDSTLDSKALLLANAETDVGDVNGNTPLHLATRAVLPRLVHLLLDAGASSSQANQLGRTPGDYSANNTRISEIFRHHAVALDKRCDWFSTGFWSTKRNMKVRLNWCVKQGLIIGSTDRYGLTLLHRLMQLAPEAGRLVDFLVQHGADVNAKGNTGIRPLHIAVAHWRRGGAKALIKRGADVNSADSEGLTPMHVAAGFGRVKQLRLLERNAGKVDVRSRSGLTPLHSATAGCAVEAVEFLLEKGADASAETLNGVRPETLANDALCGAERKTSIFKLLKRKGARFEYGEDCKGWKRVGYQAANVAGSSVAGCMFGGLAGGLIGLIGGPAGAFALMMEGCLQGGVLSGGGALVNEIETGGNCKFDIFAIGGSSDEF